MLALHMGALGAPDRAIPDSGVSLACAGVVRCGIGPCSTREFDPCRPRKVVEFPAWGVDGAGCLARGTSQAHAQQYYYYPERRAGPASRSTTTPSPLRHPGLLYFTVLPADLCRPARSVLLCSSVLSAGSGSRAADGGQVIQTGYTTLATRRRRSRPSSPHRLRRRSLRLHGVAQRDAGVVRPRAVGYDANLSNWAAMNNNQQQAQGLGHFVMGPARRQNSATGGASPARCGWLPAHRAALLDPTITWFGIAAAGAYWTFNAY